MKRQFIISTFIDRGILSGSVASMSQAEEGPIHAGSDQQSSPETTYVDALQFMKDLNAKCMGTSTINIQTMTLEVLLHWN